MSELVLGYRPLERSQAGSPWLRSRAWDLTWITLSAFLILIPYTSYFIAQLLHLSPDSARSSVNVLVGVLIGGPHIYATFTRTWLEPSFREENKNKILLALAIPAGVILLGVYNYVLLLTIFFGWASTHVLEQILYTCNQYSARKEPTNEVLSKWIDRAVVISSLYPVALYRFVKGSFTVGPTKLYFPEFLQHDIVWLGAGFVFALAVVAFVTKCIYEYRRGALNTPKTLLISITIGAAFITPLFSELDVAFQGLNIWHSFQYLGLTWLINSERKKRGEITPSRLQGMFSAGAWKRYYFSMLAVNVLILAGWLLVVFFLHLDVRQAERAYYMVILCFLLTHYYHDHLLFKQRI